MFSSCSNTGSIREDPSLTIRKNGSELLELSSLIKFSLVHDWFLSVVTCTWSVRGDPYWTSRKNSLELIELSSINAVSLV